MISFWVTREGSFGIRTYCENRGRAIAHRFQTHVYDAITRAIRFPGGAQIFSSLDRLTSRQREVAAMIWDAHVRAAPDQPRLNDPRKVLGRFELLTTLHEAGINSYRVFRAMRLMEVDRFPVFVRHMHDHDGPRTRLLHSRRQIAKAVCALVLRGFRLEDLMIVEFCDTSAHDGLFRKFSAFKVGERIMPSHLLVSRHWCVKSVHHEPTESNSQEALRYIEEDPHRDWLRRMFAIAQIDYGRVDYGVLDGVPHVWEINVNPTLGRASGWQRHASPDAHVQRLRDQAREAFHTQLAAAFVALDNGDGTDVCLEIDQAFLSCLRREAAARRRRARMWNALRAFYNHPQLGVPVRGVSKRLSRP